MKFHLCVRRSGVLGCRNENFACVLLCVFVSLDGCEVDRRRDPCAFYVPLCACVSRVCPVCVSRLPPVSFYRYRMANNELARLGDAGVGVSCRHAPHASGPHHTSRTVAGGTGKHCLLISLIHLIASSVSSQTFHSRFPSHLPLLRSPVHAVLLVVLVGLVALSSTAVTIGRHARSTDQTSMAQMVLSAPRPPSHTHHQPLYVCSWPIVAAPSCMWARRRASRARLGLPGCHGFSPL